MALHRLRTRPATSVAALLTTVTVGSQRVGMHRVRRALIERQAASLGASLEAVPMPPLPSNAEYERAMAEAILPYRARGVRAVAFGDLFLEDIRAYREAMLARLGMAGLYPIWGSDTGAFVREFVALGYKAVVVCVDTARLGADCLGRVIDPAFIAALPPDVDPAGENGEFHTFVFDGPMFATPVPFALGEEMADGNFRFCDLVPGE